MSLCSRNPEPRASACSEGNGQDTIAVPELNASTAILKEANRRRNYEMTAKILDVHHLRSVRPAAGKIKQKRKSRAACIVAALKVVGSKPSTRASERAAVKSNLAFQTQAAALPTLEVAVAPPTRQCTKKTEIRGISCSEGQHCQCPHVNRNSS